MWLDAPPTPAWNEARALLGRLGALDAAGAITQEGRALRALPLPPRLARMVMDGARAGAADDAASLAVLISERGLGGASADLAARRDAFERDHSGRAKAARGLARQWAQRARATTQQTRRDDTRSVGALLALAFPDRIAKARGPRGSFLMANGRAGSVEPHDPLAGCDYLAVAEISGRAARARILAAASVSIEDIQREMADTIEEHDETRFDDTSAMLRRRVSRRLGAIVLSERMMPLAADDATADLLAKHVVRLGLSRLPWSDDQMRLRRRVGFLRHAGDTTWPALGDEALGPDDGRWLAPFIVGRTGLNDITSDDLAAALDALVPYALRRRLDQDAPATFTTPAGSTLPIDYESEGAPVLEVRVQELFGLAEHPSIAGGRLPLTLRLLSPAHRPIQVTRDLPGFWRGSWAAVRSDMRGRYPRHPWPENPMEAPPTRRAKARGA